jgi:hypothetical protein
LNFPDEIPEELRARSISLDEIEINDPGWPYADALEVLKNLDGSKVAILGGVLLVREHFGFVPTNENWCCDRVKGELASDYARRSREAALGFIDSFRTDLRKERMVFVLLFNGQQDAA